MLMAANMLIFIAKVYINTNITKFSTFNFLKL